MEQARCTWCRALSTAPQMRSSLTYTFPFPFPIAHVSFGLSEAFAQLFTKHLWRLIDRYQASLHALVSSELNNQTEVRLSPAHPNLRFFSLFVHRSSSRSSLSDEVADRDHELALVSYTCHSHTASFYLPNFPVPNWYRYIFSLLLTCWGNSKSGYGMHVLKEGSLEFWLA